MSRRTWRNWWADHLPAAFLHPQIELFMQQAAQLLPQLAFDFSQFLRIHYSTDLLIKVVFTASLAAARRNASRAIFRYTLNFVHHATGLNRCHPIFDVTLTFTHTYFDGFLGNRFVRKTRIQNLPPRLT